ncbi:MAG TPA: hypothetical protein VHC22_26500 [Pirellulales bacterium]|nr:hypothetical protein [Pirellulales bacterium]
MREIFKETLLRLAGLVAISATLVCGCQAADDPVAARAIKAEPERKPAAIPKPPDNVTKPGRAGTQARAKKPPEPPAAPRVAAPTGSPTRTAKPSEKPAGRPAGSSLPPVDEDRIAAHNIRKIEGRELTLYTDLPSDAEIDGLPEVFSLALPEWAAYFHIDADNLAGWRVRGCLIKDRERFVAAGLLPAGLQFVNGFTRGDEIWWYEQESAYYRRHLMLHEGTHSLMFGHFGTCGPPWYMEAMAELLGTHQLKDGRLTLGAFPADRDLVPIWGRIRIVREAVRDGRPLSVGEILAFPTDAYLQNDTYGWCWAIAAFLDGHPRYRERFRKLPTVLHDTDFNGHFRRSFADDRATLNVEWRAFIHEVDYGYDLVRNAIELKPSRPPRASGDKVTVAADRGWQSTGLRLSADTTYQLQATGRYQVAAEPKIWWCEPGGVTVRYYRGRPLGILLAMILPDAEEDGGASWPEPVAIGQSGQLTVDAPGTLYLRINDSPAELADNAGSLSVDIRTSRDERPQKSRKAPAK